MMFSLRQMFCQPMFFTTLLHGSGRLSSQFVFRIGDRGTPEFKLVEAEGGIWKTEAVRKIKDYLELVLSEQDMELRNRITIIG